MALKREKTEVRREQIASAAVDIIGKDGIAGFTTARVAREVGVSEAALYRHFKNKDAILSAVLDNISGTLLRNLEAVSREDVPAIEKLERVFRGQLGFVEKKSGIPRIVFSSETVFAPRLKKKLLSFIESYIETLSEVLAEGMRDGSVRVLADTTATAATFIGIIQISALRRVLSGFRYSLVGNADNLWGSYRELIEARSSVKGRAERR